MSDGRSYEVSHIVDEDYSNPNKRVFRVHWLGYPSKYDSWEPLENLQDGALEVVREWDRKKKRQRQKRVALEENANASKNVGRSATRIGDDSRRVRLRHRKASEMVMV